MSIIASMLTRMILVRFAVILLGLSSFGLTLEVVGFLNDVLQIQGNGFWSIISYCLARWPGLLALFLPTSLLLALLMTITELSYRNELTAIWATGISPARLIWKLFPLAVVVGLLQFVVTDKAVPLGAPYLHKWGIADYAVQKFKTSENEALWIRAGDDILRADRISADGSTLYNPILFRRTPAGQLEQEVFADTATKSANGWVFENTTTYFSSGKEPERAKQLNYENAMRLASNRIVNPEEMSLPLLSSFAANNGFGVRPGYVYSMWWLKRLSPLLVTIVMVALCVPLGVYFRRGGGLGRIFVAGVLLGFAYFVIDGLATTLGETGSISPWLAALGPTLIFGTIAVALLARTDHV